MKTWILFALIALGTTTYATYNPATGTYTVDEHGCVQRPSAPEKD